MRTSDVNPWRGWWPAPMPVAASERVEVLQYCGRRAHGVACAFDWQWRGPLADAVLEWRLAEPRSQVQIPGASPQPGEGPQLERER